MKTCLKFVISLIIILTIFGYETEETFKSRINYYQRISALSNNTIQVGYNQEKGLQCKASDYIEQGQAILRIPKRFILCPYNLFPFKFEILSFLKEIPGIADATGIGKNEKLSAYLMTYYIMYYLHAPKEEIKNYIKDRKLSQYYEIDEVDESIKDSLPSYVRSMEAEHFSLMKALNYPLQGEAEYENVFNEVLQKIFLSPHIDILLPWVTSLDNFKEAFYYLSSRGSSIKLDDYNIMEDLSNKNITKWSSKNQEVNKYLAKSSHAQCIVSYLDLCNHYQPKYDDMRDKKSFSISATPQYFLISTNSIFRQGEEVAFTYPGDSSNMNLFFRYGFVIYPNIHNIVNIKVEDNEPLSKSQFNMCRELGCVESSIKDPKSLPKLRDHSLRYSHLEDSLINYGRIRFLKGNFEPKQIIKTLANKNIISFENEVSAWMFYYLSCNRVIEEQNLSIENLLYETQNTRKGYRSIEKDIKTSPNLLKNWNKFKTSEYIYLLDISYKTILLRHLIGSVNNIIATTHQDLNNIKDKYL